MKWWLVALAVSAMVVLPVTSSAAQQGTAELTATVGVDGWVSGDGPLTIHATIDADLLVAGVLRVGYGAAATEIPVDVPAGGSKTYEVLLRSAFRNGSVQVALFDAEERRLASQTLRPQVADDEVVVGVANDPALTSTLSALQTGIDGLSITAVDLGQSLPRTDMDALGYMVSAEVDSPIWAWVSGGGRLVTTRGELSGAPMSLEPLGVVPGTDVEWYSAGAAGEVFVLDDIAAEDWTKVIRPVPLELIPNDQWGSPEGSLVQAATNSGEGGLANLPWLPFAMIAYLFLIGPINLTVLTRLKRRELAWVTIPALAAVAVVGFWVSGRQRLDATAARHASVVVAGETPYQRTMVVLAAGSAGEYSIALPGAEQYAVSDVVTAWGGNVGTTSAGFVSTDGVRWELPQLGVGAVETWTPTDQSIVVESSDDGDVPVIEVTNDTGSDIEHWGAVIDGSVHIAQQALASGQSGNLRTDAPIVGWQGASFGDVLVEQRQLWDRSGGEIVSPMGYAAAGEFSTSDSFVFGISTRTQLEAIVNGAIQMVDGPTVWATPFPHDDGSPGQGTGTLIGVGDWRHIEASQGNLWLDTDRIVASYRVPTGATELRLERSANFGVVGDLQAWNWSAGDFEAVGLGDDLDPSRYRSAAGEMIVRIHAAPNGEPPFPQAVIAMWDGAA